MFKSSEWHYQYINGVRRFPYDFLSVLRGQIFSNFNLAILMFFEIREQKNIQLCPCSKNNGKPKFGHNQPFTIVYSGVRLPLDLGT